MEYMATRGKRKKRKLGKRFLFFLISLIIGFVIFWAVTQRIGWQNIAQPLSLFRHWQGVTIFLITLLISLFNAHRWHFVLRAQGHDFSLFKVWQVLIAGFVITYLTPSALFGGEIFMSYTLSRSTSLSWRKSIASIIILRILSLSIVLLFLVFGIFTFLVLVGFPPENIAVLSVIVISALASLLILFYYRSFREKSVLSWFLKRLERKLPLNHQGVLEVEQEVFSFFKQGHRKMWQGLGLTFLNVFLDLGRFWFIVFFLQKGIVSFFHIFPIFAFVNMAYALPFPTALGTLEVSQAFTFGSLGLGPELGTAFALVLRGADLSLVFIGLFFLLKLWLVYRVFSWLLPNRNS